MATSLPALAPAYRPRRPTETVLYSLVREHLETFLVHARESYGSPLPRYVEDEFRAYLRCGVFAHGFLRARCESCDHDLLVAFSCKRRGICPSCAGRRMANEAAALVDRVLPAVPLRQWVLSLPFDLRALAAFDAKVLSALSRIFVSVVERWYGRAAERAGIEHAGDARTGAVTFVQRFGSSLNLNVHFHTCFLDGVYVREASGRLAFHDAPAPNEADLESIVRTVHTRTLRWLARHGHLDRPPVETTSNEMNLPSPIEACAAIATQRGSIRTLPKEASSANIATRTDASDSDAPPLALTSRAIEHGGFNLHASVRIATDDDRGRERLCRYGARPPFSLARLRVLGGGRIAYRTKRLGAGRAKHRVMTPLELLARLAALVPPPRYPLVRYHGLLAPHAAWRREIVPRPPMARSVRSERDAKQDKKQDKTRSRARARRSSKCEGKQSPKHEVMAAASDGRRGAASSASIQRAASSRESSALSHAVADERQAHLLASGLAPPADVVNVGPNILSVRQWSRLVEGLVYATSPRLRWAELLRRTFDIDVLECPKCHGRIAVIEAIAAENTARRILERLNLAADPPQVVRARDPTTLDADEDDAA